ncbi:hypothetical protein FGADI_13318 [Fusarium gaditjirri]|uniref:Heterokaryon incompatibility domain-containing protein n=1 Tax=Fusarium gaditjirri TaxID=282569 RepID=A0A8H4SPZ8_9HYPO|nr:hypothetical protein FGADI_13318 [Fusarium gaditjirri]
MASVYQNSFLTLAATKSANSDGGCFSDPSLRSDYPLSFDSEAVGLYVREKFLHWDTVEGSCLLKEFPLLTRGWVYQERLLAPRVLHFCQSELVWECLKETTCECSCFNPTSMPKVEHAAALRMAQPLFQADSSPMSKKEKQSPSGRFIGELSRNTIKMTDALFGRSSAELLDPKEKSSKSIQDIIEKQRAEIFTRERTKEDAILAVASIRSKWHEIVRDYSNLTLSMEADRLPAIAGLARQAQKCRIGSSYLAGLWEDSLDQDLLWRVDKLVPGFNHHRPPAYRAPSWSWASVNGGVSYLKKRPSKGISGFRIKKAHCTPVPGADQFGQIVDGYLNVECILLRAEVRYAPFADGNPRSMHYKLAMADNVVTLHADYSLCAQGQNQIKDGEEIFCLRVFRDDRSTISLVLRRQMSNVYERIGIAEFPIESSKGAPGAIVDVIEVPAVGSVSTSNLTTIMLC